MSGSGNESLVKIQRHAIRSNLALGVEDEAKVADRLVEAAKRSDTRVVILAVVKFEDDEVRVVPNMNEFFNSFERVRLDSDYQRISCDNFSIAMLGDAGENAYKQCMCIANFLTRSHQGWFLTVREAVATYKKPRNIWKRFSNMFESYDKKFSEYRLVADLRKTADIQRQPLIAHERTMLFGTAPVKREKSQSQASETLGSVSSGVFSRGSASTVTRIEPKMTEWSAIEVETSGGHMKRLQTLLKPFEAEFEKEMMNTTNAGSGSESSDEDDNDTLGTLSKEYIKEVEDLSKLRRLPSSGSLSSSSSKSIAIRLPKKNKKH